MYGINANINNEDGIGEDSFLRWDTTLAEQDIKVPDTVQQAYEQLTGGDKVQRKKKKKPESLLLNQTKHKIIKEHLRGVAGHLEGNRSTLKLIRSELRRT